MDTTTNTNFTSSYFHHHHHNEDPNGIMFSPPPHSSSSAAAEAIPLIFPHSLSGRASAAPEPVKRKRGRPRKYGAVPSPLSPTPTHPPPSSSSLSLPPSLSSRKKEQSSTKKAQFSALGNAGQGFTPHVITVVVGEDVAQNIMSFIQQNKRAVCILSASGSISSASLCQPAMLGGNVTYEGRFEILSLSGSFLHMETAGGSTRTGGLNICLSGSDGHIVGGGVGGPLIAAGPVMVIAGSFLIDTDKNISASTNMDNSASKMGAPLLSGTTLVSPVSLKSCQESSGRMTPCEGSDDRQSFGGSGSSFMLLAQGMPVMPSRLLTDWRGQGDSGHGGACLSPEDEDEEHFED